MTDQALQAWQERGLEGTVADPAGHEVPAAFSPAVLAIELLLHGWDLAQGSGQTMEVSDEVVAYVAELAEPIIPTGRGFAFADEVEPARRCRRARAARGVLRPSACGVVRVRFTSR